MFHCVLRHGRRNMSGARIARCAGRQGQGASAMPLATCLCCVLRDQAGGLLRLTFTFAFPPARPPPPLPSGTRGAPLSLVSRAPFTFQGLFSPSFGGDVVLLPRKGGGVRTCLNMDFSSSDEDESLFFGPMAEDGCHVKGAIFPQYFPTPLYNFPNHLST